MPSTIDAAALCKMAERGQITGGLLDGPLALDNAISRKRRRSSISNSPVAGDADILLVPDLEAGNMLAKKLTFLADADAAGIVLGARVPIILTSRADNVRTRMASCAVAVLYAHARRVAAAGHWQTRRLIFHDAQNLVIKRARRAVNLNFRRALPPDRSPWTCMRSRAIDQISEPPPRLRIADSQAAA